MELYLNSTGIISGAGSNNSESFLRDLPIAKEGKLLCSEPDYTGLIPPMQLRRMSKAVRTGIAASKLCMQSAGVEKPDALSIGTAMGCLQDTELFLTKMTDQDEQMLTPTAFIQSTHNTVSGQIALLSGCYGHNLTFVQRGHSFEHALINASLYLDEHPGENVLTGGIDELTDNSYRAFALGGVYNDKVIAGEGATFFIAGDAPVANSVCVKDIYCFTNREHTNALELINDFMQRTGIESLDLIASGRNGDEKTETFYDSLQARLGGVPEATFKHLCGEYATASAFALGMLVHAVQKGNLPNVAVKTGKPAQLKNIVMVNHFKHYYSCWYLQIV